MALSANTKEQRSIARKALLDIVKGVPIQSLGRPTFDDRTKAAAVLLQDIISEEVTS